MVEATPLALRSAREPHTDGLHEASTAASTIAAPVSSQKIITTNLELDRLGAIDHSKNETDIRTVDDTRIVDGSKC